MPSALRSAIGQNTTVIDAPILSTGNTTKTASHSPRVPTAYGGRDAGGMPANPKPVLKHGPNTGCAGKDHEWP